MSESQRKKTRQESTAANGQNDIFVLMNKLKGLNDIINLKQLIQLIRELKSTLIDHRNDPVALTAALSDTVSIFSVFFFSTYLLTKTELLNALCPVGR